MTHDFQSASEYADAVIKLIEDGENELPKNERIEPSLLKYWFKNIRNKIDETWMDYITGKRDSYLITDVEATEMWEKAGEQYAAEILDGLHEKGLVKVGIGDGGEFYYSLSEEGEKVVKKIKKKK